MRAIWIASVVFFLGALACAMQRRDDNALLFAALGFQLIYFADSDIDWKMRLTRANWRERLLASRFKSTIVAKVAQGLGFVCMFFYFVTTYR